MTKTEIIKHLEANYGKNWCYGGKLAREIRELTGTKESVVERRCRELVNAGILEKQLVQIDGVGARVVQYKMVDVKEEPRDYEKEYRNSEVFKALDGRFKSILRSEGIEIIEQPDKLPL